MQHRGEIRSRRKFVIFGQSMRVMILCSKCNLTLYSWGCGGVGVWLWLCLRMDGQDLVYIGRQMFFYDCPCYEISPRYLIRVIVSTHTHTTPCTVHPPPPPPHAPHTYHTPYTPHAHHPSPHTDHSRDTHNSLHHTRMHTCSPPSHPQISSLTSPPLSPVAG